MKYLKNYEPAFHHTRSAEIKGCSTQWPCVLFVNEAPKNNNTQKTHFVPKINVTKVLADIESDKKLGRCSLAILHFLATYKSRSFTNAQISVATGYSVGSGGFNNSLSELNTKGLIERNNGRISVSNVPNLKEYTGNIPHVAYNIETYMSRLGKCEREIYQLLLKYKKHSFTKEELAGHTETKYSPTSGGFNNALSRLNTLELIKRSNGQIMLNPELLEI